jgi:NDP-sugar pyrophosphorylase family protein
MKAMILAAGYGTRLKPLTDTKPKALIEIKGIPLIEIIIKRLIKFGYTDIIINLHHLAEQVVQFFEQKRNFGINIEFSDESSELLDTGGGILKAKWFFNDNQPFLVYNVDVVSDINLDHLLEYHLKSKALATLAVRDRQTYRKLLFDSENQLCQWINTLTMEEKISREPGVGAGLFAYSGIQILNPQIFKHITESGAFSIIDLYLRLAKEHIIKGFVHNSGYWFDLGKILQLVDFNQNNDIILDL